MNEMMHQNIHDRRLAPPDTLGDSIHVGRRVFFVPGGLDWVHPPSIFRDACHIESGPSVTDSVPDILPVRKP